MPIQQMLLGAGASAKKTYVDDVFSIDLITGTGSATTVNNGIDLSTEGGLVWLKGRNVNGYNNTLYDTKRSGTLFTDTTQGSGSYSSEIASYNSNGYTTVSSGASYNNINGTNYASWSFRRAKGFFDVVTWTGNGNGSRQISHGLESVPGCIMIKRTDDWYGWYVYHRGTHSSNPERYFLRLNEASAVTNTTGQQWMAAAPTSTNFTLAADIGGSGYEGLNTNNETYVAYVFAHDDQSFGEDGDVSVIKCDSYTGDNTSDGSHEINLGWEPQWLLMKNISTGARDWMIYDSMRGINPDEAARLVPNENEAETGSMSGNVIDLTSTGFKLKTSAGLWNTNGDEYIYVAIRRSDGYVGKPPSAGSDCFQMDEGNSSANIPAFTSNFPVDFALMKQPGSVGNFWAGARLIGKHLLRTNGNNMEATDTNSVYDSNIGWHKGTYANTNHQSWMWKRGKSFDCVQYKGNGTSGTQISHSCNAVPQMIWIKERTDGEDWTVGHHGANGGTNPWNYYLELNQSQAEASEQGIWNNTAPSSTVFTLGNQSQVNESGGTYLAMLFCSVAGISKVGSYTGTSASSQTITTGFQPRFIIIKRTDTNAQWFTFDTLRGWVSNGVTTADDKVLMLNADDAQWNHAFGHPISTGFVLNGAGYGNNGGASTPYIYYAHA